MSEVGWRTVSALVDLVLPADCAGCASPAGGPWGVCDECVALLGQAVVATRPTPAPQGLPPCLTLGSYDGALRELILAYKERGRRGLARPLGNAFGGALAACLPVRDAPVVLVPVPATAAAVRARHGDHMRLLARYAARRLRRDRWRVSLAAPLRALPKADSAHLDRQARARAAQEAFVLRPGPLVARQAGGLVGLRASGLVGLRAGGLGALRAQVAAGAVVVVIDDVITTGVTIAAVCERLSGAGVPAAIAMTLAATRLRHVGSLAPIEQISLDGLARWG